MLKPTRTKSTERPAHEIRADEILNLLAIRPRTLNDLIKIYGMSKREIIRTVKLIRDRIYTVKSGKKHTYELRPLTDEEIDKRIYQAHMDGTAI